MDIKLGKLGFYNSNSFEVTFSFYEVKNYGLTHFYFDRLKEINVISGGANNLIQGATFNAYTGLNPRVQACHY